MTGPHTINARKLYRDIEVERVFADKLSREVWTFTARWVEDNLLVLDAYNRETRHTTRHKWRGTQFGLYYRLARRGDNKLSPDEVPLPDDITAAAIKVIVDNLEVRAEYKR